jgi:hypothetical protein
LKTSTVSLVHVHAFDVRPSSCLCSTFFEMLRSLSQITKDSYALRHHAAPLLYKCQRTCVFQFHASWNVSGSLAQVTADWQGPIMCLVARYPLEGI